MGRWREVEAVRALGRSQRRPWVETNLKARWGYSQADKQNQGRKHNRECGWLAWRFRNDIKIDSTVVLVAGEVIGVTFGDLHDMRRWMIRIDPAVPRQQVHMDTAAGSRQQNQTQKKDEGQSCRHANIVPHGIGICHGVSDPAPEADRSASERTRPTCCAGAANPSHRNFLRPSFAVWNK